MISVSLPGLQICRLFTTNIERVQVSNQEIILIAFL